MKLFVKKYLRKLPVIDQFCNMFLEYSRTYPSLDKDSYEDHKLQLKGDSVRNFIDLMVLPDEILKTRVGDWNENTRENYITYLVTLFNTVKGTYKVLDYLTEYDLFQTSKNEKNQNSDNSSKINYTTQSITIEIQEIPGEIDRNMFCDYLEAFLSALLYFESLTITINKISTKVTDNTTVSLNHGEAFYQYFEVEE